MVGQIAGQKGGQIVKCSTRYADTTRIAAADDCAVQVIRRARKGKK